MKDKSGFLSILWKETDKITKWIQVCVWILAGIWAYFNFRQSEQPSLELRASANSKLTVECAATRQCFVTYSVNVNNIGKRTFDVTSLRVRAWKRSYFTLALPATERFLDPKETEDGNPFFDQTFTTGSLVRHYAPDQGEYDTFQWLMKEPTRLHFRADFQTGQGTSLPYTTAFLEVHYPARAATLNAKKRSP